MAEHTGREAALGAYVAADEADADLERCRADLAALLGVALDGVAFTESASAARQTALACWPLEPGDTIAVVPSEWGPNLASFANRGLELVTLPVRGDGTIDLARLEALLTTDPPTIVHLTLVASHRPLVQPVSQAAELCRRAGVALWVDAAQALGHVDCSVGADLVYATSRKWLSGPRGVGILAVAETAWEGLRVQSSPLARGHAPEGSGPVRLLESQEANVAGRVGLAVAVAQFIELGPADVWGRLAAVGAATRQALEGLEGWEVVDPAGPGSAITALRASAGQDVALVRARLLAEHAIVTTAQVPARAPMEMGEPTLRISPHVDCTPSDLERLRHGLALAGATPADRP